MDAVEISNVIVLHGGPGAPGDVADLARGMADTFHVLEPHRRANAETRADMLRLQKDGIYQAALAAIRSPVPMLHDAAADRVSRVGAVRPLPMAGEGCPR